jgi:hypothetical protein
MIPARYRIKIGNREVADSDSEKRAREYADRWCRAAQRPAEVWDTAPAATGAALYFFTPDEPPTPPALVIYTAHPPRPHGIPLPRPWNLPDVDIEV